MVSPSLTTISVACGVPAATGFGSESPAFLNGLAGWTVPVVVLSTCGAGASAGAEAVRIGAALGALGGGSCWTVTGSRLERLTDWLWLPSTGAAAIGSAATSPG